jgi:hypothetical protein
MWLLILEGERHGCHSHMALIVCGMLRPALRQLRIYCGLWPIKSNQGAENSDPISARCIEGYENLLGTGWHCLFPLRGQIQ